MLQYVVAYVAAFVSFLAVDYVWLSYASTNIYRPRLGDLLLDSPNIAVAGVFYLVYSAATVVLAVVPAINGSSGLTAVALGAILGLAAYGTYDITNLATVRGWSVTVTVIDIGWGAFLTGLSAGVGYLAAKLTGAVG